MTAIAVKKPRKPGSGRKPGSKNKVTLEARALAQKHAGDAMLTLVGLMTFASTDMARIAACNSILDRAYGRPGQSVEIIETKPDMSGWSARRVAAYHDLDLEQFEQIQQQLQDDF